MGLCYNDCNTFNRFNISRNKGDWLMINGIKPLPSVSDFDSALNRLLDNIHKDYQGWSGRIEYSSGAEKVDITLNVGRKFIKIIRDNSVWGFVAKSDLNRSNS